MNSLVTAVVIDDHPFFRDGVVRGLSQSGRIRVVGEAGNGRDGIALIGRELPAVAVVDYQMPDIDGLGVVHAITRDALPTRVLLLSAVTDGPIVYRALESGAAGYIGKDSSRDQIVQAVVDVAAGRAVLPAELTASVVDEIRLRRDTDAPVLSDREREVLLGFAAGKSIPQLATELYLSPTTVKTHAQRLYEKLGVSDRAAAVAVGMRHRLME